VYLPLWLLKYCVMLPGIVVSCRMSIMTIMKVLKVSISGLSGAGIKGDKEI